MSDKNVLVRARGLAKDYKRGIETVHVLQALVYALVLGLFGGLLPSIRAARQPIVRGLREL